MTAPRPSALSVRGLVKTFGGTPVLRGLDLDVDAGTVMAVLGPSGGGKTTLLRILAGFEFADAGTVSMAGALVAGPRVSVPPERRRLGIVPQHGALFPHMSVAANVGYGVRDKSARPRRVAEALELVGLAGLGNRMPHELSGGQQQRVAVARALAPQPALILLDEPFSALDAGLRAAVRADVRAALHAADATAVLVTHDQQEALSIADQVAVLRDGRTVQSSSPEELYHCPVDLGVGRFVGEAVVLEGELLEPDVVTSPLGPLTVRSTAPLAGLPLGSGVSVLIRPEQIVLTDHPSSAGAGPAATVLDRTFLGSEVRLRLRLPTGEELTASCRNVGALPDGSHAAVTVQGPVCAFPRGLAAAVPQPSTPLPAR